jgi:hypothetical protein
MPPAFDEKANSDTFDRRRSDRFVDPPADT